MAETILATGSPAASGAKHKKRDLPANYTIVPLYHLIKSLDNAATDEEAASYERCLRDCLKGFRCESDERIRQFVHEMAWPLEKVHICTTQLIVDERAYQHGELKILGLFTLMPITVAVRRSVFLDFVREEGVTEERWREYIGEAGGDTLELPAYQILIIARNEEYEHEDLDGRLILREAERLLNRACDTVGGNLIFLDSTKDHVEFYRECDYRELKNPMDMTGTGVFAGMRDGADYSKMVKMMSAPLRRSPSA